jgi:GNAT superfamily N-acetyltransferase
MATIDHAPGPGARGPDCGIYFVATRERFRRRGLATRLMRAALAEARERGCATSSLQASGMGEPVYAAMGYEHCFRFHLYERRRA